MNLIILGTGGCGKTSFAGRFGKYLKRNHYTVKFLNLDPGVQHFDYKADYDIRDKFTVKKIMDEENLGPNGAMISAMEKLSKVKIKKFQTDYVLTDTPGQLEVFLFHKAGTKIIKQFDEPVGIFLIDGSSNIDDLPGLELYALTTIYKLGISAIIVINKADMLNVKKKKIIKEFLLNPAKFSKFSLANGIFYDISQEISHLLQKILPAQRVIFVSAKTGRGFCDVLDMLHEIKCSCGDLY